MEYLNHILKTYCDSFNNKTRTLRRFLRIFLEKCLHII